MDMATVSLAFLVFLFSGGVYIAFGFVCFCFACFCCCCCYLGGE